MLVFFRVAGLMLGAPIFGSSNIPKRMKVLLAIVLAWGLSPLITRPELPTGAWTLAVGIGGEIIFGWAMGMALSFTFIAVTWAGEIIGQQMGINLGETFDPQYGHNGALIGDMYFMLALILFMAMGGHREMITGIKASFTHLPLLGVGMDRRMFGLLTGWLTAATMLAVQLAAPMLLTMLVIDLALGFIGKTLPQLNVMSTGTSLKSALGIGVLLVTLAITNRTIGESLKHSMEQVRTVWSGGQGA